ncbi:NAD(P)/FAD-dependent oxidoreductase [Kineosporia sp. J2-2]|uniref:NAD(P)/FAD-dependent oxidoreductase n=1 Tax=Kineosporia corallincola TaxID=2835133 RepID=A0ABS5TAK1_9ACTN|nr:NAD(P)/FAD-dependent oxidoreductase [Kineosporia corallincola]MBT0768093.1 NAD(P)/FAD-dependent oxidoreductase [Kineosporia corallincola]
MITDAAFAQRGRARIVIVGAGFAGFEAARALSRTAGDAAEIVLVNPTNYFLYLPLLPEVAAGTLDPRRIAVSLSEVLPKVRLVLGSVENIDLGGRTVSYLDPEQRTGTLGYDRLVLAAGSVNKLLPIPGVSEFAHGFRGIPEAVYLRDHITRQIALADTTDDQAERDQRCTFVVAGAGYTGTEVAAQGPLITDTLLADRPRLAGQQVRWLLLDTADRVLPTLDERLSRSSDQVLRQRGVEVLMGTTVKEATAEGVRLTSGDFVRTRSLIWCVGVQPDPLVSDLGLPLQKGRLVVDEYLGVPGHPEVFACGDIAAVPDLTRPGETTAMTAQHATRQGKRAAANVAASFGHGERKAYRHHDLGFVVDLGGPQAAANPLRIPLSGLPAKAITRGYHLLSMPGNRVRTAADWALNLALPRESAELSLVRGRSVPLASDSPETPQH